MSKPSLVPPSSLEAEQTVLGSIFLRAKVMDEVADILTPDDFYRTGHGLIFKAMLDNWTAKKPVDMPAVTMTLTERNQLSDVGGPVFLADLSDHVGTAANAPYYARVVRDKAQLRRFLEAMQELTQEVLTPIDDAQAFFDAAETRLMGIVSQPKKGISSLLDVVERERARIESLHGHDGLLGLSSGFIDLDRITGGFQPGDLILLAARPSMGKSALALNFAFAAARLDVASLIYSMEMSEEQWAQRAMAKATRINSNSLRTAKMEPDEWVKLLDVGTLLDIPVSLSDKAGMSPLELRATARRMKASQNIGLVVVDYLQLMNSKGRSREQEVSEISRSLKALAKELSLPVIALCQLNREVEKRGNRRPIISDLRDSGSLEQDADVILFIYREEVYNPETQDKGIAEIHVAKQRMGQTKTIKLLFEPEYSRFLNYAE